MDTVGLHDTALSPAAVLAAFGAFSEHVPHGIDVFAFVVKWGRYKPEHRSAPAPYGSLTCRSSLGTCPL